MVTALRRRTTPGPGPPLTTSPISPAGRPSPEFLPFRSWVGVSRRQSGSSEVGGSFQSVIDTPTSPRHSPPSPDLRVGCPARARSREVDVSRRDRGRDPTIPRPFGRRTGKTRRKRPQGERYTIHGSGKESRRATRDDTGVGDLVWALWTSLEWSVQSRLLQVRVLLSGYLKDLLFLSRHTPWKPSAEGPNEGPRHWGRVGSRNRNLG